MMDSLTGLPTAAASPSDSPAGIHCANPDCRTRAGERSRGHQSCRALLCGHCCQHAAKVAAEAGEQRPVCKVHARRVHTGHRPSPKDQLLQPAETNNWTGGGDTQELQELFEKRAKLEQSLKRSLTMVVWYRNGCEPLRLAHEVTTFPLFQLQDFPELVGELGLQSASYVDTYNIETGQWEQHKISTVRSVEQEQRLLYRLRPSLLDSLTDCPFLDQELSLQPHPIAYHLKRQSEPLTPSPSAKQARVISNSHPVRAPATPVSASPAMTQSWESPNGNPAAGRWSFAPSGAQPVANRASSSTAPQGDTDGSPPGRRWPTDFSVHEITEGFDAMGTILKADASARQRSAFEHVFAPCRYVKSTVGRAKLYWKRASPEVKDHFLALPRGDPRARWMHFVHLMDGRLIIELGEKKDGEDGGKESADEEEAAVNGALGFDHAQVPQPRLNGQSPTNVAPNPTLPMNQPSTRANEMLRQPSGILIPNPGPPHQHSHPHHPGVPAMSIPQGYTTDRSLSLHRSSSSLSGAIMTMPNP
ncbi:hypothetical protein DFH11DRAFT_1586328 [Phellopilus nigrolimitatus]|nr:hypothetical protein DFH11DRAFT_1586328 [Phellopilus nigrolimitatus]